jgi:hypothetical protein
MAVVAMAAVISGQQVNVNSNAAAPFATYRTYAWAAGTPSPNPLGEHRIHAAVDAQLAAKGLTLAGSSPDLFVATHVTTLNRPDVIVNGFGWGLTGVATIQTYVQGTIVVDLYDGATRKLVWRGVGTDAASEKAQDNAAKVDKALAKMFKQYPPV